MEIRDDDIEAYDAYLEDFKRHYEKTEKGKIFTPVKSQKALEKVAAFRREEERKLKLHKENYSKKLDELIMNIDPKVKTELDLRLAKGEITEEEYQKVIRTLVWTNKAYLPPSFREHLEKTGPKDPALIAAEKELKIKMAKKDEERELEGRPVEVMNEGEESQLEKIAKATIQNQNEDIETGTEEVVELDETEDSVNINTGMQLISILKSERDTLSMEASVALKSIANSYAAINQGCGCTKNKRMDIAFANFKRTVQDLALDLGIIDAVKKATGKNKVVFSDSNGNVFLET